MNTIPLVKGNTQEEINTSLIALKKALDEMNSSSGKTDASVQSQIKQINELITNINSHLDTIDEQITGLQPVNSVTSGNMHSVTSNAVYNELNTIDTATYPIPSKVYGITFQKIGRLVFLVCTGNWDWTNIPQGTITLITTIAEKFRPSSQRAVHEQTTGQNFIYINPDGKLYVRHDDASVSGYYLACWIV